MQRRESQRPPPLLPNPSPPPPREQTWIQFPPRYTPHPARTDLKSPRFHKCAYVCKRIHICMYVYMYIYAHSSTEREKGREDLNHKKHCCINVVNIFNAKLQYELVCRLSRVKASQHPHQVHSTVSTCLFLMAYCCSF